MDSTVVAAYVTAAGFATASLIAVVGVVWEWHQKNAYERERQLASHRRRRRNLLAAIHADIDSEMGSLVESFGERTYDTRKTKYLENLRDPSNGHMPLTAPAPSLFEPKTLKDSVELIPPELIVCVTTYYKSNESLNLLLAQIGEGHSEALGMARREEAVVLMMELGRRVLHNARVARRAIAFYREA